MTLTAVIAHHRNNGARPTVIDSSPEIEALAARGGLMTLGDFHRVGIKVNTAGKVFVANTETEAQAAAAGIPLKRFLPQQVVAMA